MVRTAKAEKQGCRWCRDFSRDRLAENVPYYTLTYFTLNYKA